MVHTSSASCPDLFEAADRRGPARYGQRTLQAPGMFGRGARARAAQGGCRRARPTTCGNGNREGGGVSSRNISCQRRRVSSAFASLLSAHQGGARRPRCLPGRLGLARGAFHPGEPRCAQAPCNKGARKLGQRALKAAPARSDRRLRQQAERLRAIEHGAKIGRLGRAPRREHGRDRRLDRGLCCHLLGGENFRL